jgi:hypothetical protein
MATGLSALLEIAEGRSLRVRSYPLRDKLKKLQEFQKIIHNLAVSNLQLWKVHTSIMTPLS